MSWICCCNTTRRWRQGEPTTAGGLDEKPTLQESLRCFKRGQTALHRAALNGHLDIVTSLLRHKANVEALDVHRHSALHDAARYGYPAVVQLLLEHKANVEAKDVDGRGPKRLFS